MIDFTGMPVTKKTYAGANGGKISVIYSNERYMLKFPPAPSINKEMRYSNSCISEYLGCHIFAELGFPAQETLLGTYSQNGSTKTVVACKDFTGGGIALQDFASLKNTIIQSSRSGYGIELDEVTSAIEEQTAFDPKLLSEWFWDMFIVDAFIGNWDRHNGNWGFLYNETTDEVSLAPIYDCGSSLYPQADEKTMKSVLEDKNELDVRIFSRPLSAVKINGKKINYFDFISSAQSSGCTAALTRVAPRIDMERINAIIDNTPFIGDLQKRFYKTMLSERKKRILDFSLKKLGM